MPKNVKRLLVGLGVIALAVGGAALASGAVANADTSCSGPISTHTDRPDSGHHGDWADLSLTRSVVICSTGTANHYTATITDDGSLTTRDGQSPREGKPLAAGATGTVHGTYAWTFVAENLDLTKLVSPPADTTTGNWLKELVKASGGKWCSGSGSDYTWTYTTCAEKWVDSSSNDDGTAADAGDITGLKCTKPVTPELVKGKCTGANEQSATTLTVPQTEGIQYQDGSGNVSGTISLKPNQEFTLFAHVLAGYTVVDLPAGWFDTGDGYDFAIKLTAPEALNCAPSTTPSTPAPPSTTAPKPSAPTHKASHHAVAPTSPQSPAVSPAAKTSSLASTGAQTGLFGGIALGLLGLGGLALLAGRRRRGDHS
jgi:hypothetical protein